MAWTFFIFSKAALLGTMGKTAGMGWGSVLVPHVVGSLGRSGKRRGGFDSKSQRDPRKPPADVS